MDDVAKADQIILDQFTKFDLNGDGFISLDEFKAVFMKLGATEAEAVATFRGVDINGDGKAEIPEFVAWLAKKPTSDIGDCTTITTAWGAKIFPGGIQGEKLDGLLQEGYPRSMRPELSSLLEGNGAMDLYMQMVSEIRLSNKGFDLALSSENIASIVDKYKANFRKHEVLIFFCRKLQMDHTYAYYKWLEFADAKKNPTYTPAEVFKPKQIEETISSGWGSKIMPSGVFGERLEGWKNPDYKNLSPNPLFNFLEGKNALSVYISMLDEVARNPKGVDFALKSKEVAKLVQKYRPAFRAKTVNIFACRFLQIDARMHVYHKWLEFSCMQEAGAYVPAESYNPDGTIGVAGQR